VTASDPFVTYDAAYVLGALSPEDRQEFEEHLLGCARCSAAVREMSVIPGVLSRTGPPPAPDEPPAGLLTDVLRRVRRGRRIRNTVTAVSASVAVAAVVALGVTTFPGPAAPPSTAMTALGTFPVRADARLDARDWGTQVEMSCSYTEADGSTHDYVLVAIGRDGSVSRLATWLALPLNTARIVVGTPMHATEIQALEIRSGTGLPLLRLKT